MSPEISSGALLKVADGFAREFFQSAKGVAAKSMGKLQAEFGLGFQKYVERNRTKCRFVKTLLHRVDPVPIERTYVEPSLKIEKEIISGSSFPERLNKIKNIIVVGNGGSGKSMFLKNLFLELCEYPLGRIPLFIELRDLNLREDKDLLKLVHYQWSELIPSFKLEALEAGFRSGKFTLLLDGLDEVDKHERVRCSKNIMEFSYKFLLCPIVLTSRPIGDFAAWHEFYTAEIQPFDLPRIAELIEKTSIDEDIKTKFLSEIRKRLFVSHRAFLANPLLCTMMMLTYNEFEEIPSKMHIFYSRAFDVLFTRHDKTKTFFNRKFHTKIAEDDFKRFFSTFCLFSYLSETYSFDRDAALKFLKQVFEFENSSVDPLDYLSDLHESVSILIKDGDTYSFLHRSFQEYFSAMFLAERQLPKMDQLFDRILRDRRGDSVLHLLFEMNRDAFETKFLIRKVRQFRNELVKLDPRRNLPEILSLLINRVQVVDVHRIRWVYGSRYDLFRFVSASYDFKSRSDNLDVTEIDEWAVIVGRDFGKVPTEAQDVNSFMSVSSVSNASIAKTSLAPKLALIRAEVIGLDDSFKKKDKNRNGFVTKLLVRK